ncbi:DUF4167 domain-containing protein [Candidatus Pelagibacter sp.]|nr:DUF4167 domain-containing protein [Candidatus Pelagibacter sp.]
MVTFRNNNNNIRRNNFRRNDRNFKTTGDRPKFSSNYSNNENFKRKIPGRNNHNASKLIEKYNDLAREASSSGDKILSENYLQHADHFMRVMNEQEASRKERFIASKPTDNENSAVEKSTDNECSAMEKSTSINEASKDEVVKKAKVVTEIKKTVKSETKAI